MKSVNFTCGDIDRCIGILEDLRSANEQLHANAEEAEEAKFQAEHEADNKLEEALSKIAELETEIAELREAYNRKSVEEGYRAEERMHQHESDRLSNGGW